MVGSVSQNRLDFAIAVERIGEVTSTLAAPMANAPIWASGLRATGVHQIGCATSVEVKEPQTTLSAREFFWLSRAGLIDQIVG